MASDTVSVQNALAIGSEQSRQFSALLSSVSVMTPCAPNVVLLDAGHLLYHVVWPVSGTTGGLAASFGTRLAHYPPVSKKIILFDRYDKMLPAQRTISGREEEEPRKYV